MPEIQTLPEALQHWAREKPDSAAFIFRDKHQRRTELTWSQVYKLSGRFAAVLRSQGLVKGDLVGNPLVNSPERVVCELALWMSGIASVNTLFLLADGADTLHTLRTSRASAVLVDPDMPNSPWTVLKNHVVLSNDGEVTWSSSSLPDLKRVIFVRRKDDGSPEDFIGKLETLEDWFCAPDVTADVTFSVMTSSGSTGFPKLAVHTQGPLIESVQRWDKGFMSGHNMFNGSPMGWMGGNLLSSVVLGYTRVSIDERPGFPEDQPRTYWACIQAEQCLAANLPASYLPAMASVAKSEETSAGDNAPSFTKLLAVLLGGQPVNKHMVEAGLYISRFVVNSYALLEFGFALRLTVSDSESFVDHDVGKPAPGVEFKVVSNIDESKPCAAGEVGTILLKSPVMMKGYLNDPKTTAASFTEDGFFRTRDLGRLDERGHLIVDGRGGDAIQSGIYTIYPTWVENTLRGCPSVSDVVVVGVPESEGEYICACVVLQSGGASLEQVRQFAEDAFLRKGEDMSGCPRQYLEFDSFPHSYTDKINRKQIKKEALERLGAIVEKAN